MTRVATWSPSAGRRRWQWAAILALSILLHLLFLDLLPRWTVAPDADVDDTPLRARLVPLPVPAEPKPDAPVPSPAPVHKQREEPTRPHRPSPPPEFVPEALAPSIATVEVGPPTKASPPAATNPAQSTTPATVEPPAGSPALPDARPPQSARLSYKVSAVDEKNFQSVRYYGVGTIDWVVDGARYRSALTAAIDFLLFKANVLASHSEGQVAREGLVPDRYTETPRKRPTLATNFNRDGRQSISFSATEATAPLPPGAQDRLSILFQLSALLAANDALTTAGTRIDVPVAGVRDAETWTFDVIGIETIDPGHGAIPTVHLRRTPRPGTNDRTIDVWIAQGLGGYPARVLYTEPVGSTIDMTLDRIGTVPDAAARR